VDKGEADKTIEAVQKSIEVVQLALDLHPMQLQYQWPRLDPTYLQVLTTKPCVGQLGIVALRKLEGCNTTVESLAPN
jgi:hypothetical protein